MKLKTLAPWKESCDKPRKWIKKQRRHCANKAHIVKAMTFPVVMYRCEIWTIKKAECQRIDAFELWCWSRHLNVHWTARRSNQSILKEINPEHSLEGCCWSFNTLSTWCKEPTHWKRPWCWERLKAEREGNARRLDAWMAPLTQCARVWASSGRWCRTACCSPRGRKESDKTKQMNNSWFKLFYSIQVSRFCFWSTLYIFKWLL